MNLNADRTNVQAKQEAPGNKSNKKILNENSTEKENETKRKCQAEKEVDFYEIIRSEIKSIQEDPSSHANESSPIMKTFLHPSIENLHQKFGYRRSMLKLTSLMLLFQDKEITDGIMNDFYWECMHYRLNKHGGRIVACLLTDIDKLEETMATTLQEARMRCLTCCICKKGHVAVLYLPCGHLIICSECFRSDMKNCQACQTQIDEAHTTFM